MVLEVQNRVLIQGTPRVAGHIDAKLFQLSL